MTDESQTDQLPLIETADDVFTPAEMEELRELYAELPSAAEAAAELLGASGPMPTGMRLERFMELDARIVGLVLAIEKILTR